MADNYLEKRMEQYRSSQAVSSVKKEGLASLLIKNRSTRGYDASYIVRADQLRRIVGVNNKLASARNRQPLRFRLVTADEAQKVLPFPTHSHSRAESGQTLLWENGTYQWESKVR